MEKRTAALVALTAFLPFLRGALSGECFYFRDLSRQFFPLRRFAVEGLLRGEIRWWNPLLNEGVPLSLPPVSYPLDLLQMLLRDEAGFSLLLALHVPLGALAFLALGRGLGLGRTASAGGAVLYALGGFYLSTLNLYVYLQAAAWAPLVVLGLVRAAQGNRRWQAAAASLVALSLSTTGAEIVAQAAAIGLTLALAPREPRRLLRAGLPLVLGAGLAAPTLVAMRTLVAGSARASGFPTDVVLAHSIDPWTLGQVVVGNWHGDLSNLTNAWWGSRFFPLGFPYVLSLYLGGTAVALAAVGAIHGRAPRGRLIVLAAGALIIALGRFAGLAPLVDALPMVHAFRYPTKAFFSVHLCVALLATLGLDRLGEARASRTAATAAAGIGGVLVALPWLPLLFPGIARWFLAGFLPPAYTWPERVATGELMAADAARGGVFAAGLAVVAAFVVAGRLAAPRATILAVVLLAADVVRTGAGLNPTVTPAFYQLSPEVAAMAAELRHEGGRAFSCDPESGPAYFRGRRFQREHDAWTFAVFMETLTPAFNMPWEVPTAYGRDLTMLVPEERALSPEEAGPAAFPGVVERLRAAGVSTVLSLDSIEHPALRLRETLMPRRIAPLAVHAYSLTDPLPLHSLSAGGRILSADERPGRLAFVLESDGPGILMLRDAWSPGWVARVNGLPAPVGKDGGHQAVPVPEGRSEVVLRYEPPGLGAGLAIAAASLLVMAGLLVRRPSKRAA